ncbi:MAG: DUF2634 domain-containing protein [Firmicutes bacterium]|nr:DUF2634 domain-containing protein [Bacillota bacterium]
MLPSHANQLTAAPQRRVYPSRTYRHFVHERTSERQPHRTRITTPIDGLEAMEQRVRHILGTERYQYAIYPDWYGIELEKYRERDFAYFRATISQTLTDALTTDDRIDSVTIHNIYKTGVDGAGVDFTVNTNIGNIAFNAQISVGA